jgi:aspartate kinase
MRIVVQKYGGSSVSDLNRIGRVADRIVQCAADGTGVVVVVSAMGTTTDQLIDLAHRVSARPDRRELDMLLSVGERVAMSLVAMALRERGVDAVSLTGSQSGIITDEAHADAKVVEVRPARVQAALDQGRVVIVAGFQGVSRTREVTTLGRGGSDTTAVVLAAALGAEHCEICSDVDGVWTADPRVVPKAIRIDELGLDHALAMARGGAKVLFEDAIRYARDRGVTLQASSTFGPGSGTRLAVGQPVSNDAIAVSIDRHLVAVRDLDVGDVLACGGRVRRQLGVWSHVDVRNAHGAIAGTPIGVVSAVGSALVDQPDVYGVVALLSEAAIAVSDWGASGDSVWWQVAPEQLDDAARVVHRALVERD